MNRTKYFDVINVFACISVVILHCNSYVHSFAHDRIWAHTLVVEVIFYSAVPLFFMLSGATLFEYRNRYSNMEFYKRRIEKTVVPYLFFSCFFFWIPKLGAILIKHKAYEHLLYDFIKCLFTGNVPNTNYWFFIPLFMFYIFLPFISLLVSNCSEKELVLLLSIVFIYQSLGPLVNNYVDFMLFPSPAISGYCFYGILGYFLSKENIKNSKKLLFIFFLFTVLSFVCRYYLIYTSDSKNLLHFSYFGWYAVFPAIFIFLLFKFICENYNLFIFDKIAKLSKYSFGVYLIHGFLISLLPFSRDSLLYRLVSVFIIYFISVLITFIIKKIPIINKLIP